VVDYRPFRHMLEFLLDWNLIYRDTQQGQALLPTRAAADHVRILRDPTGVNLMIEVRKPSHG
jgi:extracellular factor (EF) 3-hydroxypalmitic acid methyl ester biosynthesis protein